jgi:hypothetical protein
MGMNFGCSNDIRGFECNEKATRQVLRGASLC